MKLVINFFLFCFICLISISIKSQNVTANIESDSILIGKELFYTIDIDMEKAENIIFPDSTSFVPFELISETKVDTTVIENGLRFSKKYGIKFLSSGILYRYASYLILKNNPKNKISFLKKKFKNVRLNELSKIDLHTVKISEHTSVIAKEKKIREILKSYQR